MMALCMIVCLFTTNSFAQLKEVRGVQTRSVKYTEYVGDNEVTRWGYELENENNYDVWIEVELNTNGFTISYSDEVVGGVRDTKNLTLKGGETYIWKCGDKMRFFERDYHERFYITYKAYKAE